MRDHKRHIITLAVFLLPLALVKVAAPIIGQPAPVKATSVPEPPPGCSCGHNRSAALPCSMCPRLGRCRTTEAAPT